MGSVLNVIRCSIGFVLAVFAYKAREQRADQMAQLKKKLEFPDLEQKILKVLRSYVGFWSEIHVRIGK